MKTKLLLGLISVFLTFCLNVGLVQAQTWDVPVLEASPLSDGSVYYIENTGLNLQLGAGGWWNTQAVVKTNGLQATLRLNSSTGLYIIEFSKGNTLFRTDNGGTYTDNTTDNTWNIQIKDEENLTYTIQAPSTYNAYNANQFLGTKGTRDDTNNGAAYVVAYDRNKDTYAKYIEWKFLNITLYNARVALYKALNNAIGCDIDIASFETIYKNSTDPEEVLTAATDLNLAVLNYKANIASPENPADVTFVITNPGFDNNTAEGWTGGGTVNYHSIEFYQLTFDLYQKIEGLPAGRYKLKAQGFERPKNNDSGAAYKAGTETIHAVLYAKGDNFPESRSLFNSLYQHSYSGDGALNGYANSMAAAERLFVEGNYEMTVADVWVGESGSLTIGARSDFQQSYYWVIFDNFRLEYEGSNVDDILPFVNEQMLIARELSEKRMQNSALSLLNDAIAAGEEAVSADPLAAKDLYAVIAQLAEAIDIATISAAAYSDLQEIIDSALALYDDGSGNDALALQTVIEKAQSTVNNPEASLDDLKEANDELQTAIFVFNLANATGTAPRVTTNTNFARGSTAFLGRSAVSGSFVERGFCWAEHPEPTILDNRTTKNFLHNGSIYHIENLKPATVYYMRAYAISRTYAVGYGDVIKVITLPKGNVTYTLTGSVTGSGEHYPRIASAMASAIDYFNTYTSIQGHHVTVSYHSGTPTAEASYGGYLQFGANSSYQRTGTALHEMGHTIGVGTHSIWYGSNSVMRANGNSGNWLGDRASKMVQFFDNTTSGVLTGDGTHMWPYGINGAHEDNGTEILYIANSVIHQALGEDGLPPTHGFATPAYTFEHNDNQKYYIKSEAETRGRNDSFLMENSNGNLVYKAMSPAKAMKNDSTAWHFTFDPSTGYYQIQNLATGKYFTYLRSGTNGIGLTSKPSPGGNENFQLMRARIDTKIGSGTTVFKTRGYWMVYPQKTSNPFCFTATVNGGTSATSFNLSNTATTQRWLLLTEDDLELFEQAMPSTGLQEISSSGIIMYGKDEQIFITDIPAPTDIRIYDVSGRLYSSASGVFDSYSQNLPKGIYIVSIRSTNYQYTKKIILW